MLYVVLLPLEDQQRFEESYALILDRKLWNVYRKRMLAATRDCKNIEDAIAGFFCVKGDTEDSYSFSTQISQEDLARIMEYMQQWIPAVSAHNNYRKMWEFTTTVAERERSGKSIPDWYNSIAALLEFYALFGDIKGYTPAEYRPFYVSLEPAASPASASLEPAASPASASLEPAASPASASLEPAASPATEGTEPAASSATEGLEPAASSVP